MARFMIVDDTKIFRRILRDLLENMGHTIALEAKSGEEALEIYDHAAVDCVLLDVEMGGISGIETLKELKERHSDVKVIMVSSVSEANRLKEAAMSGAAMAVQKPIKAEALFAAIKQVIG